MHLYDTCHFCAVAKSFIIENPEQCEAALGLRFPSGKAIWLNDYADYEYTIFHYFFHSNKDVRRLGTIQEQKLIETPHSAGLITILNLKNWQVVNRNLFNQPNIKYFPYQKSMSKLILKPAPAPLRSPPPCPPPHLAPPQGPGSGVVRPPLFTA
jgi:hypothetical protein